MCIQTIESVHELNKLKGIQHLKCPTNTFILIEKTITSHLNFILCIRKKGGGVEAFLFNCFKYFNTQHPLLARVSNL